jgi:hypothetical protein
VIATTFEVINEFNPALIRAYSESRIRPDLARATNQVMKFWVSFAMEKMYPAQRAAIKSRLEAQATRAKFRVATGGGPVKMGKRGENKSARYLLLKNSVAAYIVWSTNWKWGGQPARTMDPQRFYAAVGRYIGARQFSVGYLRSGMRPGLNTFRAKLGLAARDVKYKRGEVGRAKEATPNERIPTAEVENFAGGIIEKFPRAFLDALPQVEDEVNRWIVANLAKRGRDAGLNVTS